MLYAAPGSGETFSFHYVLFDLYAVIMTLKLTCVCDYAPSLHIKMNFGSHDVQGNYVSLPVCVQSHVN